VKNSVTCPVCGVAFIFREEAGPGAELICPVCGALADNSIECPCHSARFNIIIRKVTQGPATKPINVYQVSVENGTIAINI
jgi:Rieske Fe-S protein